MTIAIIAEKPSVARDIAAVVGAKKRGQGFISGNGYVVTWALGHLVALGFPQDMNPGWKSWRWDTLPMIPKRWVLKILSKSEAQFQIIQRILGRKDVKEIVCATDAGREGELIFRLIMEKAECQKPTQRLWISSLTPEAIKRGFAQLKPSQSFDNLALAARARSRADWLVGINLSRAYSLTQNRSLSVGRVQTPTLAMIVDRELVITAFKPETYFHVEADFSPSSESSDTRPKYTGTWFDKVAANLKKGVTPQIEAVVKAQRLPCDGARAREIVDRIKGGTAQISWMSVKSRKLLPPQFYDLTELQRHANRIFGFSAKKTLDVAQSLYEKHKLISYPRTDCRTLPKDVETTLKAIVEAILPTYREHLGGELQITPLGPRFVNDTAVSDHHAIIPTSVSATRCRLTHDEARLYDLICRRLLSAWLPDHITQVTHLITEVSSTPETTEQSTEDAFFTSGTQIRQMGWKVLDLKGKPKRKGDETPTLPAQLSRGQAQVILGSRILEKQTKPPKRFTEATLLTAMETAGKTLDDRNLSEAMKERGLGTPATRAATIETLLEREFIERGKKVLFATEKGIGLIAVVHPDVKSPEMTGSWEFRLKRVEAGHERWSEFIRDIERFIHDVIGKMNRSKPSGELNPPKVKIDNEGYRAEIPETTNRHVSPLVPITSENTGATHTTQNSSAMLSPPKSDLEELLRERFGFAAFRPYQHRVCRSVVAGDDALLVMPTGAGKSLCFQLPGIARGGTTLVVSPLIALMEDQVAALCAKGFRAGRIHSGRGRDDVRETCRAFLEGRLDFLFVAPERFRVKGFIEMLAKRPVVLIAIDEAHCISHWGHDFRPDYRMLGGQLFRLRPAPVIALTATATPQVQDDIIDQLNMPASRRFIHGFRRDNISIEIESCPPRDRPKAIESILSNPEHRPAIVYTPTRDKCERLAESLSKVCPADVYHAGKGARHRDRVQDAFLAGGLEVIVATVAFGMGIDKANIRTVIHAALPGSMEAYYQEIGRAGRDGLQSKAILFHSYGDMRILEFLHEKNYPEPRVLATLYGLLSNQPQSMENVTAGIRIGEETQHTAIEKLWVHGGVHVDEEERLSRGTLAWRETYPKQKDFKHEQILEVARFADSTACRMATLVDHFGDREDGGASCGICDFCAPESRIAARERNLRPHEIQLAEQIMILVQETPGLSTGRLYGAACPNKTMDRRTFEELLRGMVRSRILRLSQDSFEKNGRVIHYRKAFLEKQTDLSQDKSLAQIRLSITQTAPNAVPKPRRKKAAKTKVKKARPGRPHGPEPDLEIEKTLKEWRRQEAKRRRIPAFRIFGNQTLRELARDCPRDEDQLLAVHGVGPVLAKKYGSTVLQIIQRCLAARG